MKKSTYFLSIVGYGARGLHALEIFYSSLARKGTSDTTICEAFSILLIANSTAMNKSLALNGFTR
jgi:hypothetical protein